MWRQFVCCKPKEIAAIYTRTRTLKGATLTPLAIICAHSSSYPWLPFCPSKMCLVMPKQLLHFGSCLCTLWPCNAHVCVQNVLIMGALCVHYKPKTCITWVQSLLRHHPLFVWENDWWSYRQMRKEKSMQYFCTACKNN